MWRCCLCYKLLRTPKHYYVHVFVASRMKERTTIDHVCVHVCSGLDIAWAEMTRTGGRKRRWWYRSYFHTLLTSDNILLYCLPIAFAAMSTSLSLEERLSRITKSSKQTVYKVEKRKNSILRDSKETDWQFANELGEKGERVSDTSENVYEEEKDRLAREAELSRARLLQEAEDAERERLRRLAEAAEAERLRLLAERKARFDEVWNKYAEQDGLIGAIKAKDLESVHVLLAGNSALVAQKSTAGISCWYAVVLSHCVDPDPEYIEIAKAMLSAKEAKQMLAEFDDKGRNGLMQAVEYNDVELVRFLLGSGLVERETKDRVTGNTALEYCTNPEIRAVILHR